MSRHTQAQPVANLQLRSMTKCVEPGQNAKRLSMVRRRSTVRFRKGALLMTVNRTFVKHYFLALAAILADGRRACGRKP
jgi:hypothetical protein